MSPRKLTEDDKQEILYQYRNSQATTSTLAKSYEVSSSTISRFLKNKLSSTEYEDLIQQKRLARTPRGEKSSAAKSSPQKTPAKKKHPKPQPVAPVEEIAATSETEVAQTSPVEKSKPTVSRRRRRSRVADEPIVEADTPIEEFEVTTDEADTPIEVEPIVEADIPIEVEPTIDEPEPAPTKLVIDRIPTGKLESENISKSDRLILKSDRVELNDDEDDEDEEDDAVDLITLKEMLGEDLEDINDEDDDEDDDDWNEDEDISYSGKQSSLSSIQILPLSQASFPRTCYLVIDRCAELIVKPLAEFADLGSIPEAEVKQRTLPVFENHHIAKRFSHRRERVIKVPDGRMIQKTSHHLQVKGITRLLMDGQIYSLSNN
jgi:transposase-like protein